VDALPLNAKTALLQKTVLPVLGKSVVAGLPFTQTRQHKDNCSCIDLIIYKKISRNQIAE